MNCKRIKSFIIVSIMLLVAIVFVTMARVDMLNIFGIRANAEEDTSGICGDNLIWVYDTDSHTLTISGTGSMYYYETSYSSNWITTAPWRPYYSNIQTIIIENGVTSISTDAFRKCSNISKVVIADSVESIGGAIFGDTNKLKTAGPIGEDYDYEFGWTVSIPDSAFINCNGLTDITLPNSITTIGAGAFSGCSELTSLFLPNNVSSIGASAFNNCNQLTSINIPTKVTVIDDNTFQNCSELSSITIPENVTSIGNSAFKNCVKLEGIIIPDKVTSIGYHAFDSCSKISTITIPSNITNIGVAAFYRCTGLEQLFYNAVNCQGGGFISGIDNWLSVCSNLSSVVIGDRVESIPYCAFYTRSGIKNILIPDSVTSIGEKAFQGCSGLERVELGCNVSEIGYYTFADCANLEKIVIPNSVKTVDSSAFYGCLGLKTAGPIGGDYNFEFGWNDSFPIGAFSSMPKLESIVIPSGLSTISEGCFSGCSELESVEMPSSVTIIDNMAFYNCSKLGDFNMPVNITNIGERAFYNCSSLENLTIPQNVTSIGREAFANSGLKKVCYDAIDCVGVEVRTHLYEFGWFYNCNNLEKVLIGTTVNIVPEYAFYDCSSIANISIANGVKSLGNYSFYGCSNIEMVTIPESVEQIGREVFYNCSSLETLNYNAVDCIITDNSDWLSGCESLRDVNISQSVKKIPNFFLNDIYYYSHNYVGPTSIIIPEGVISIGDYAFKNCSLLTYVTIPSSVTSIGRDAFASCYNLENVALPSNITYIGCNAFAGCDKLTSITIPECVTEIGSSAFSNCDGLETLNFNAINCHAENIITSCPNLRTINLGNNVELVPANSFCHSLITDISIPNSVTTIGELAFYDCLNLTSIVIPNSTITIGKLAFYGCENLTSIKLPNSIKSIGRSAFGDTGYYNDSLNWENDVFLYIDNCFIQSKATATSCPVKEGTVVIADYAFSYCNRLESITLPNSVANIGMYAFDECSALTSIEIPYGVNIIKNHTFSNCSSLRTASLPDSIVSIEPYAFYFCSKLSSINLPNGIESIGSYAFAGGKKDKYTTIYGAPIVSLTLPQNCSSIGDCAFSYCNRIQSITFPTCDFTVGKDVFVYCNSLNTVLIPFNCTYIDGIPFLNCTYLESIMVDEENPQFSSDYNGVLYSKDKKTLLKYPEGKTINTYAITEGTEKIATVAFVPNNSIKAITFPSSINTIENGAFSSTTKLATVYYPGTQSAWYEITIEGNNAYLTNATKYFEHTHLGEITTVLKNAKEPTCTEKGYSGDLCCSVCSAIIENGSVQPAKGHYSANWIETKSATCSEFGERIKKCDECGETIATERINKLPHNYEDYTVQTTCTTDGCTIHICTECGHAYTDNIIPAGHDIVTDDAVAATCTHSGLTEGSHCSRCKTVFNSQEEIPILPHSFTNYVYNNDATTDRDGTETAICDNCDATDTRVKPGTKIPEPDKPDVSKVKISAPTGTKKINWRCKAHLTATAANLPGSCHIEWYENGKSVCDKADFVTASLTEAHTYTAKIIDEKGNVVSTPAQEKTVTIEVKDDFFTKIISFFSRLFGSDVVKV